MYFVQANDTLQQDRDKMVTLDGARLQYGSSSRVILAVDCDELLVPEGRQFSISEFKKELFTRVFGEKNLKNDEELLLVRRSVPGATDHPVINISDKMEHVRNFDRLSKCFMNGKVTIIIMLSFLVCVLNAFHHSCFRLWEKKYC